MTYLVGRHIYYSTIAIQRVKIRSAHTKKIGYNTLCRQGHKSIFGGRGRANLLSAPRGIDRGTLNH